MTERRAKGWPIEAQSAVIARAMASICNDERAAFGVMSGHDRKTLRLSVTEPAIDRIGQRLAGLKTTQGGDELRGHHLG